MKKLSFLIAVIALIVSGCASIAERTFTVSESQIQQKMNERLSLPLTVLRIFNVTLSNPLVRLDPTTERISATLDAQVNNPLISSALKGRASISGKLRFNAATQTVVLAEPRVDGLNIDGLNPRFGDLITVLTATLGNEILNELPLYTLKPDDLRVAGIQFNPKDIKVTPQGLQILMSPR